MALGTFVSHRYTATPELDMGAFVGCLDALQLLDTFVTTRRLFFVFDLLSDGLNVVMPPVQVIISSNHTRTLSLPLSLSLFPSLFHLQLVS